MTASSMTEVSQDWSGHIYYEVTYHIINTLSYVLSSVYESHLKINVWSAGYYVTQKLLCIILKCHQLSCERGCESWTIQSQETGARPGPGAEV